MTFYLDYTDSLGRLTEALMLFLFGMFNGWFIFMCVVTTGMIVVVYMKIIKYYMMRKLK